MDTKFEMSWCRTFRHIRLAASSYGLNSVRMLLIQKLRNLSIFNMHSATIDWWCESWSHRGYLLQINICSVGFCVADALTWNVWSYMCRMKLINFFRLKLKLHWFEVNFFVFRYLKEKKKKRPPDELCVHLSDQTVNQFFHSWIFLMTNPFAYIQLIIVRWRTINGYRLWLTWRTMCMWHINNGITQKSTKQTDIFICFVFLNYVNNSFEI